MTKIKPNPSTAPSGTAPLKAKARFTKWTASQPVTKQLALAADGSLQKKSTADKLYAGSVTRLSNSPGEFIKTLQGMGPNDCLSYGIPISQTAKKITTCSDFEALGKPVTTMPRTGDAMTWPDSTGILMVDYDPENIALAPNELREALYACCPPLRDAAHVWAVSTSSCVFDSKTKLEIHGVKGQRVYVFVDNAIDIPRAAKVLAQRAWLHGHGHIKVSISGALLERCIIDTAVFQTNRIDYCAPAICEPPLVQKKPKPQMFGNAKLVLDTTVALPELSAAEEAHYEQMVARAKAEKETDASEVRARYIEVKAADLVAQGVSQEDATKTISDALKRSVLGPHFVLIHESGAQVTVGQLLKNRQQWHGHRFADPIDPNYHQDKRIARAYLMGPGRPRMHSFAHGGCRYELTEKELNVQQKAGQRFENLALIAGELGRRGELYQRAGRMVSVRNDNTFEVQNDQLILTLFDRCIRFENWNNKDKISRLNDPSLQLARQFLNAFVTSFPSVHAIVTAPILEPKTLRLIETTGLDQATGVYAATPDDVPLVKQTPNMADVIEALATLWSCVRLFPFVAPVDQSVMLTAMLTAVERPLLPTAPGFAFDAPVQGSGKSLLTKVLAVLSGVEPVMSPHPGSDGEEEMRKALFARLLEGRRVIVFDNVVGDVDSATLAAVLTSSTYSDRLLGASATKVVPTNALILMSGNNISLKSDLPRRVLKCRIDPKCETPHQRSFQFDPAEWARENRQQMVAAALTLICGFKTLGNGVRLGPGRMASFEDWDDMIRQTVCWLTSLQAAKKIPVGTLANGDTLPHLVDPFEAVADAIQDDPALLQLGRLLEAWASIVGTGHTSQTKLTVKDLVKLCWHRKPTACGSTGQDELSLREVLFEIAGIPRSAEVSTKKLGNYFASHADRVLNGRALRSGAKYQGSLTWWVEELRGSSGLSGSQPNNINDSSGKVFPIKKARKKLTGVTEAMTGNQGVDRKRVPGRPG